MQEVWKHWKTTYNKNGEIRAYEISSFGNVKINGNYFNPCPSRYYYLAGELIHRLVAELFIPNPDNKPCVDHIDTNTHNNRVDNLRWVTYSENMRNEITYARTLERSQDEEYRKKLSVSLKGKGLGKKLSEETRRKISEAGKGRTHKCSDEARQKMSLSKKESV